MTKTETLAGAIKIIVPTGMLGGGVSLKQVQYGIARGAAAIAVHVGGRSCFPA